MDIKFHCDSKSVFENENIPIRAFLYSDYHIESHNHDFYEINIVIKGKGIHKIENTSIMAKTGDVFVIPPMVVHAYYNTENLDVCHILVHKNFVMENEYEAVHMPGFLQFMEIEPFLREHFSDNMFLNLSVGQLQQLKSELSFIMDGSKYDREEFLPLKKHATLKIIYWLSGLLYEQLNSKNKKALNEYEHEIIRIIEYMHQNYGEKITIDVLCKKVHLSRSTFLRNFYNVCGCTPIQYLSKYTAYRAQCAVY